MKFSVLLSLYSKENSVWLEQSLESIWFSQSLKPNSIILVLDGPLTPELYDVVTKWHNKLIDIIKIVSLPKNVGLASALNEGLKHCVHDLVARMDTDDIALPDRFEKQIDFMQTHLDVVACGGVIAEFDDNEIVKSYRNLPLIHDQLVKFAKSRSPLSHPSVMFRKSALLSVGGYPNLYPEDYLLWVKLIQNNFKIANLPVVLVKMRTNSDFIKRRGWRFLKGELRIYLYMYNTKFIDLFEFLKMVLVKSVLRLSPDFIKVFLYKVAR